MEANDLYEDKYTSKVAKLLSAFQSRFSEHADHAENNASFTNLFNVSEEKINYLEDNLEW